MKKVDDFETVYDMIEHAIELAFDGRMQLKFYEFLKYRKTKKEEVDAFLQSSTAKEISDQLVELQEYLRGMLVFYVLQVQEYVHKPHVVVYDCCQHLP